MLCTRMVPNQIKFFVNQLRSKFLYLAQLIKNAVIDAKYKEVMEQVLKQNSYFFNPENILLAMINDERKQELRLNCSHSKDT